MEEKIKRLLRLLQTEFVMLWVLTALLVVFYECDVLPQGVFVDDAQAGYVMQTVGILLTVSMIPLSLCMFNLSVVRYVKQLSLPDALVSYRRWSEVRLAMLLAPSLFDMSVYYTTLDTTGLLCAGMVLLSSFFCMPGRRRLLKDLDLEQDKSFNP